MGGKDLLLVCDIYSHMELYDFIFQDMPKPLQPNFVLDVEASELFIQAGLQDRVIQVSPASASPCCV